MVWWESDVFKEDILYILEEGVIDCIQLLFGTEMEYYTDKIEVHTLERKLHYVDKIHGFASALF